MGTSRRGFLGMLLGGAAATAGGVLIPKAVAAKEKIEISGTREDLDSLLKADDGEIVAVHNPDAVAEILRERANLYAEWWKQASPVMWAMPPKKYNEFIEAHMEVNKRFGIDPEIMQDEEPSFGDAIRASSGYEDTW